MNIKVMNILVWALTTVLAVVSFVARTGTAIVLYYRESQRQQAEWIKASGDYYYNTDWQKD
jgi:hypothetical protein